MDKIYMVVGWFGDQEWNERAFASEREAERYCAKMNAEDKHTQYYVEEHEVY